MFLKNIQHYKATAHAWLPAVRLWSQQVRVRSRNAEHGTKSIFPIKPAKGCWDQKMDHRPNQSWSPPSTSTIHNLPAPPPWKLRHSIYSTYLLIYLSKLHIRLSWTFCPRSHSPLWRVVTIKRGMSRWDGPGNCGQVTLDTAITTWLQLLPWPRHRQHAHIMGHFHDSSLFFESFWIKSFCLFNSMNIWFSWSN